MAKKISVEQLRTLIDKETRAVLEEASMRDRLKGLAAAGALAGGIAGSLGGGADDKLRKVQPIARISSVPAEEEEELELPGGEKADPEELPSTVEDTTKLNLQGGYDTLDYASDMLQRNAPQLFNGETPLGRATISLAALLGGLETLGKGASMRNPFSILGGRNADGVPDRMVGFAQFDADFHAKEIGVRFGPTDPETKLPSILDVDRRLYSTYLGRILQGLEKQPNGKSARNFAADFLKKIQDGSIRDRGTLQSWMVASGLGGSNWDAVDGKVNGWNRIPGLSEQAINFVRSGLGMEDIGITKKNG